MTDYEKYRGKCKELSEQACSEDNTLQLIRGHYFCPFWNTEEAHWWCVRKDGTIHDPSKAQFPSNGEGIYTPFDGKVECAQCGKLMEEKEAQYDSRFAFCGDRCHGKFIGIFV